MLEARKVYKSYGVLQVLKGVDIQVQKGEVVSLVGSSGAGKSTFLQILGLLDRPHSGSVFWEGQEISSLSDRQQARFRNENLGFVFQFHHLLPEFTALENICMPAFIAGMPREEAEARAQELLDLLKLFDRSDHKPAQLSGGEQQRVAMARALMNKPRLILADEPTGNLDSQNSRNLYDLIFKLSKELEVTFLIATHNEAFAKEADRILYMQDGYIRSEARPALQQ